MNPLIWFVVTPVIALGVGLIVAILMARRDPTRFIIQDEEHYW